LPQPAIGKPAYLVPITDPTFHTKLTRIADDTGKAMRGVSGAWSADARHALSKRSAME